MVVGSSQGPLTYMQGRAGRGERGEMVSRYKQDVFGSTCETVDVRGRQY